MPAGPWQPLCSLPLHRACAESWAVRQLAQSLFLDGCFQHFAMISSQADSSASLSTMVICLYVSLFGCLLCCFETHLQWVGAIISDNFGFM